MSPRQKQLAYIGAGVLVLLLLYRWYSGGSGSSGSAAQTQADGTAGADYSQLAGQEQSDTAALGNTVGDLTAQETSDVSDITGQLGALEAQEQADSATLAGQYSGLADQLGVTPGPVAKLTDQVNRIAKGEARQARTNRGLAKQIRALRKQLADTRRTATHRRHASGGHSGHHGHQSAHKHAGSGTIAPSTHEAKPHVTAHGPAKHTATPISRPPARRTAPARPHPQQHPAAHRGKPSPPRKGRRR